MNFKIYLFLEFLLFVHQINGRSAHQLNSASTNGKRIMGKLNGTEIDGRANSIQGLITGGTPVLKNYPFLVLVVNNQGWYCGGSILNKTWILTAAHCITLEAKYWIFAGSKYFKKGKRMKVKKIIMHPDYNDTTTENDLALLQLSKPLIFSDIIQPISLVTTGDFIDEIVTFAGWGEIDDGSTPYIAYHVNNTIMSDETCTIAWKDLYYPESMVCTVTTGGLNSCFGDSGGPGFVLDDGEFKVFCLVSWGSDDCLDGTPGLNTRITEYIDWISSVTGIEYGSET